MASPGVRYMTRECFKIKRAIAARLLASMCGLQVPLTAASGTAVIGHVVSVEGTWSDRACKDCKIDQGYRISTKSVLIRKDRAARNAYITIRLAANGAAERFDCTRLDCASPIDILARVPRRTNPSPLVLFLQAAWDVGWDAAIGPENRSLSGYARTLSRGIASIHLSDSIITLHDGRPEFGPSFAEVSPGSYLIEVCRVTQTGASRCPDLPVVEKFEWPDDARSRGTLSVREPALYELFRCERLGDRVFRRESAFVLVAANDMRAKEFRIRFEQFTALMKGWDSSEVLMLQRAYLQHLNISDNR